MTIYYFDTCIWRDHFENRFGPGERPLGRYVTRLIMLIIKQKDKLVISNHLIMELNLVTQNIKDFEKFKDFVIVKRPEELL